MIVNRLFEAGHSYGSLQEHQLLKWFSKLIHVSIFRPIHENTAVNHVAGSTTPQLDTHLFWCLEPCRCAWYCATELSVTLHTSQV